MASFSVVNNIASVNAQANLLGTNIGPEQGAEPPVERLPHQHVGRRRGRPGGREPLSLGRRDHQPGHPQRQRRLVGAPDQGRRAQQHLDPARSSRDAGDPVGVGSHHHRAAHDSQRRKRTDLLAEIDREAQVAGLDADAGVNFSVFVSNDSGNETISSSAAINDVDANGLDLTTPGPLDAGWRADRDRARSRRRSARSAAFRARSVPCRTACSSRSRWRSRR